MTQKYKTRKKTLNRWHFYDLFCYSCAGVTKDNYNNTKKTPEEDHEAQE